MSYVWLRTDPPFGCSTDSHAATQLATQIGGTARVLVDSAVSLSVLLK